MTNDNLNKLGAYGVKTEVNKCSNAVYAAAGVYPMIGRPPYGSVNQTVRNAVSIPWFNWNVDTLDWKNRDANYVYNYVINNVKERSGNSYARFTPNYSTGYGKSYSKTS